jgi:molecular chaperone GrpE
MEENKSQSTEQETSEQQDVVENMPPAEETAQDTNPLQTQIQQLQQQVDESKKKFLYLLSDFESFKRNASKERLELITSAGRDILAALLPVIDDFDRAAKSSNLPEGMQLIHHKLVGILKQKGLVMMELKPGDPFNSDEQEALAEIPAPSEELKGKIVDIIDSGYLLGDKVLRFAKVVVGK